MIAENNANLKEVVIFKEEAVFWMDNQGRWHNQYGPFQHKRVIDYFNFFPRSPLPNL